VKRKPPDLATLRRRGIQEGLLGGNRRWLAIGGAAWALRAVQWAMARPEQVIYRGTLERGETLVVQAQSPRHRRGTPAKS
jgi:hypothetical protein